LWFAYSKEKTLVFDLYTDSISFAVLGEDERQKYLGCFLKEMGYSIVSKEEAVVVLLPIPYVPEEGVPDKIPRCRKLFGGCLPVDLVQEAGKQGILCYDYMQDETFVYQNTVATAEGVIAEAIMGSPINLSRASCLVIGYGHCGQTLVSLLEKFNCRITVCDNEELPRARACVHADFCIPPSGLAECLPHVSYIFNTAPAMVLDRSLLPAVREDVCILDLASTPGGIDYETASALGCNASLLPGLPGKYAPKASAQIMLNFILHQCEDFS